MTRNELLEAAFAQLTEQGYLPRHRIDRRAVAAVVINVVEPMIYTDLRAKIEALQDVAVANSNNAEYTIIHKELDAQVAAYDKVLDLLMSTAMSDLVSPDAIERIVGVARHPTVHYGRAVTAEETVYVLHSTKCKTGTPDLRDCPYSLALDRGIDLLVWFGHEDVLVPLEILRGRLVPKGWQR